MGWLTPPIFKDGRCRCRRRREHSRRRPLEPPVQGAGLRPADRAERSGPAELADAGIDVHDRSHRAPRSRRRSSSRPPSTPSSRSSATAGPDAAEVERARNTIETGIVNGLQRLGGFGGVADRLNTYEHYLGDPGYLAKDLARYRATTPESVKAFAAKYLTTNSRVVVFGVPGEKKLGPEVPKPPAPTGGGQTAEGVNADEAWRSTKPEPGRPRR